jgi:hypothetical protein
MSENILKFPAIPAPLSILDDIEGNQPVNLWADTMGSCGEPTGVLNKLWVGVWHSLNPQKTASIVMPSRLHTWIGPISAAEVGKIPYSCFFPLMFTFREKLSQVSPVPKDYNVTPPPPRITSPPQVATVYNKLTGGGGGWCVSIPMHSLPDPSFMHVLSSACCLFRHLPWPPTGFLGQPRPAHER